MMALAFIIMILLLIVFLVVMPSAIVILAEFFGYDMPFIVALCLWIVIGSVFGMIRVK